MSKDLPYFRFTPQEWQNGDISLLDISIKGLFIDICSFYWVRDCSITQAMLEQKFANNKTEISQLFSSNIIKKNIENDFIIIEFLNEQFDELTELRKRRQLAGSKGGKVSSNAKAKLKQCSSYKDKKDKKDNIILWKTDFEIYKKECNEGYKKFFENENLLKEQERLNPGINVRLSIEKGYKNFWCKEAGWKHKKTSRTKTIDWESTIINSIALNKVYYTREELAKINQ